MQLAAFTYTTFLDQSLKRLLLSSKASQILPLFATQSIEHEVDANPKPRMRVTIDLHFINRG